MDNPAPEGGKPCLISVVICAYTKQRLAQVREALASAKAQAYEPKETLLVVDHNPELLAELEGEPGVRVIANTGERGLAGARNTGIDAACGEVIAFMDDDARAEETWLDKLATAYEDVSVIGAGGRIVPIWEGGRRPEWLAPEFFWVVGCSYRGMLANGRIRNVIGCNMSFRSSVFREVGGFRPGIGRSADQPLGCEETEICIRALDRWPEKKMAYVDDAVVYHHVPAARQTLTYFARRCYFEGESKIAIRRVCGPAATSSETKYLSRTIPNALLHNTRNVIHLQKVSVSLSRVGTISLGVGAVGAGFLTGMVRHSMRLS